MDPADFPPSTAICKMRHQITERAIEKIEKSEISLLSLYHQRFSFSIENRENINKLSLFKDISNNALPILVGDDNTISPPTCEKRQKTPNRPT